MQRRLLFSTVAVAFTAVLLFGLPLGFVLVRLQINTAHQQVQRDANTVARTLQNRLNNGLNPDISDAANAARALPDRYVSISRDGGSPRTFGDLVPPGEVIAARASTKDYRVLVEADTSNETAGVTAALAMIGSLALLSFGVAVVLARRQARRLARPLQELASAADRLGSGDARPLGWRYGVAELDRVAEGLDGSAQRISDLLSAEREFAADASHQLRTPLTALSMRLEEMMAAADDPAVVREEGAAALQQTERLAEVVGQLLGRTRAPAAGSPERAWVDDLIAQQVVEWDPVFRSQNRKLEVTGKKNLRGYVTPGMLSQVIATLLDNALVHGAGTVTIRTSQTAKSVVIKVRDEGKGVPADLAPRIFERSVSGQPGGTGLGLALARSILATDGGQVVLVRPRPAVFAVFLPRELPVPDGGRPAVSGPA
jgi:signal transduction histidine kinase